MQAISVIILAGGASRRMGTNKALLAVDGGQTLIEWVVEHMASVSDDLVLVNNSPELFQDLGIRQVADIYPGQGPLAGVHAGLQAIRHEWAFAMACDMPLVDHRLVRYMVLLGKGHQAVVPRFPDELEPLHALYHRSCLPAVEEALEAGHRRLVAFYPAVQVRFVEQREVAIFDPDGRTFFNVNTPADLETLKRLLRAASRRRRSHP